MNIQRFAARTSHEAMARARHAFGDDAIVLHSQPCAEGVELVAMSSRDLSTLQRQGATAPRHDFVAPAPAPRVEPPKLPAHEVERAASAAAPASAAARADVRGDIDLLSMTTLSFQDYVRQRMRQRRREGGERAVAAPATASVADARVEPVVEPMPQPKSVLESPSQPDNAVAAAVEPANETPAAAVPATTVRMDARNAVARLGKRVEAMPAPTEWMVLPLEPRAVRSIEPKVTSTIDHAALLSLEPMAMPESPATPVEVVSPVSDAMRVDAQAAADVSPTVVEATPPAPITRADATESAAIPAAPIATVDARTSIQQEVLLHELRDMKRLIETRVGTLALTESLRDPRRAQLAQRLVDAGFSPVVVRSLATRLPDGVSDETAWVELELGRLLVTAPQGAGLEDAKGVFAFVGPTGSGKTGCVVKVASAFVARHGASQLGLITLDGQRAGGHEALRAGARAMGVAVHVAHDRASLLGLLQLLASRRLLLIDTPGVSPRDAVAANALLETLGDGSIRRMLVVAATSQGEGIDDAVQSFGALRPSAGEPAARAGLDGALLAKVDEAVRLGPALDALVRRRLRLWGVAQGTRPDQDWHRPDARSLLHRALHAHVPAAWRADASQVLMLLDSATASA